MQIIFMGTPDFAVPPLERLVTDGHTVMLAVTQQDKPRGRGHKLTPTPVKAFALTKGIPVYQPDSLKPDDVYAYLKSLEPDLMVVAAYGKLLPRRILDIPRHGCINVHASLLPKYRGAAPIQWAVLNGEERSGVTIMQMDAGLDTGDILLQATVAVGDKTAGELYDVLAQTGAEALSQALKQLKAGALRPVRQQDLIDAGQQTCYAPMLDKSLCNLDFTRPARQVLQQIRGLNPWPAAVCILDGKKLKVYTAAIAAGSGRPGQILSVSPLTIACGEDSLILEEMQAEGGKRMPAEDYLRGHPLTSTFTLL